MPFPLLATTPPSSILEPEHFRSPRDGRASQSLRFGCAAPGPRAGREESPCPHSASFVIASPRLRPSRYRRSALGPCRRRQHSELSWASISLATSARSSSATDTSRKHASTACLASSFLPRSRRTPAKASCNAASVGTAATAST